MLDYLVVFAIVVITNTVPFLMPPTWLVLAFFYNNFTFDLLGLALTGAIASTLGRFLLSHIGTFSRRFMNTKRKKDMDFIGNAAKAHPVKAFLVTLLFALSPFPSNIYFLGVGFAKARSAAVFAGFFIGRFISYYFLITTAKMLFENLGKLFEGKLVQIIIIDVGAVIFMLFFMVIDWPALVKEKKLKFIPIKLRK